MKFPEFVVDFYPLVIVVNTTGTKVMKMMPGEVGRAGLKVQCEVRNEGENRSNVKSKNEH